MRNKSRELLNRNRSVVNGRRKSSFLVMSRAAAPQWPYFTHFLLHSFIAKAEFSLIQYQSFLHLHSQVSLYRRFYSYCNPLSHIRTLHNESKSDLMFEGSDSPEEAQSSIRADLGVHSAVLRLVCLD